MDVPQCIRSVPDRQWLLLLNSLVFIFSSAQCTLGMNFIVRIFHPSNWLSGEDQADEMLTAWIVLTALSFLSAAAATFGLVAAHRVSMDQLITYFGFIVVLVEPWSKFHFTLNSIITVQVCCRIRVITCRPVH